MVGLCSQEVKIYAISTNTTVYGSNSDTRAQYDCVHWWVCRAVVQVRGTGLEILEPNEAGSFASIPPNITGVEESLHWVDTIVSEPLA